MERYAPEDDIFRDIAPPSLRYFARCFAGFRRAAFIFCLRDFRELFAAARYGVMLRRRQMLPLPPRFYERLRWRLFSAFADAIHASERKHAYALFCRAC